MLQPARRKYRKEQKGRNKGLATVGNKVSFGEYGLKATMRGRLTARDNDLHADGDGAGRHGHQHDCAQREYRRNGQHHGEPV